MRYLPGGSLCDLTGGLTPMDLPFTNTSPQGWMAKAREAGGTVPVAGLAGSVAFAASAALAASGFGAGGGKAASALGGSAFGASTVGAACGTGAAAEGGAGSALAGSGVEAAGNRAGAAAVWAEEGTSAFLKNTSTARMVTTADRPRAIIVRVFLSRAKLGTVSVTVPEPGGCAGGRHLAHVRHGGGDAVLDVVLGLLERALVMADDVDLVFANVLVGTGAFVREELGVFAREVGDHVVVRARHHDLARAGRVHDALGDVDPVADDVRVPR